MLDFILTLLLWSSALLGLLVVLVIWFIIFYAVIQEIRNLNINLQDENADKRYDYDPW